MRKLDYLSPTSIAKWEDSVEAFYLYYLTDNRPPREPQTKPMAVGSAFDAFVKAYLHGKLFGKGHADSNRFAWDTIFEAQVEEQNRTEARQAGAYCFEIYKQSGALLDLLTDLQTARSEPRFEFDVGGAVSGYREGVDREINNVVLLGKPDAYYTNRDNVHVILDWKVNGFYSKWPTSPVPGYTRLRGMNGASWGCHKNCSPYELGGMTVNIAGYLEHYQDQWARQLSIYAWLLGESVGSDFIVAVDQLTCKPIPGSPYPTVRVAEHKARISPDFQWTVFRRACEIWKIIQSGHIFSAMTLEESEARCALLDRQAEVLYGSGGPEDQHWLEMTKR